MKYVEERNSLLVKQRERISNTKSILLELDKTSFALNIRCHWKYDLQYWLDLPFQLLQRIYIKCHPIFNTTTLWLLLIYVFMNGIIFLWTKWWNDYISKSIKRIFDKVIYLWCSISIKLLSKCFDAIIVLYIIYTLT